MNDVRNIYGHTVREDFQHFLAYSGMGLESEAKQELMFKAFEAAWRPDPINGDTSDGYHTFNELYHHRAVLFAALQNAYPDLSWKAKKHADGTMFNDSFIAGINTPDGMYTYHCDLSEWDMFTCNEIEYAPEWDGHMPKDVGRVLSLYKCA